ncbi:MAG: YidB family protein [Dongiaceae bacterium]
MGLLDGVLGGGSRSGGGMSPLTMALLGLLAYRTFQGKGRLAEMLGRSPASAGAMEPGATEQGGGLGGILGSGGLGGMLGGLFGGGAGDAISHGLGDLVRQFDQGGLGDKARSWIGTGSNQPVSIGELERVLGPEKIDWLMQETGMSREELLQGLSRELPQAVDRLTPDGRLPTREEVERLP